MSTAEERFWAKVDKDGPNGCWLWIGARDRKGYGLFHVSQEHGAQVAHRFAYELLVAPIPDGLQLDHLCRVTSCVNPEHLEPVTGRENLLRGTNQVAENVRKTECPYGHPYDDANTYRHRGKRYCLICMKATGKARREKIAALAATDGAEGTEK